MPERPLLLVDVDGVLSLFGPGVDRAGCVPALVDGIPHFLSRRAAGALARVAPRFECVWCTGWEDRAEEHLPRLLGLPGGWRHLSFTEPARAAPSTGSSARSTRGRVPSVRWPGSTTITTTAAARGRARAQGPPCW